jgi:hypothetical protein
MLVASGVTIYFAKQPLGGAWFTLVSKSITLPRATKLGTALNIRVQSIYLALGQNQREAVKAGNIIVLVG